MSNAKLFRSWLTVFLLAPLLVTANAQSAKRSEEILSFDEKYDNGWQFYFDNDISFNDEKDRNYTGGIALTITGSRVAGYPLSLDPWLNRLDRFIGLGKQQSGSNSIHRHAMEFGLTIFTPDDIAEPDPIENDHPYANMLFISNSQSHVYPDRGVILQSTLMLGILGTDVGEEVQKAMHNLTGSNQPRGWNNQISDGGELTAKYSLSVQKLLLRRHGALSFDIRSGIEAGIGYTTDINSAVSFRIGRLNTPWWSFTPHQSEYISFGQTFGQSADNGSNQPEFFLWGGLNLKYRFYNAILQGQFRDSAVTYDRNELESVLVNGWLGITKTFSNGMGISFVMRKQNNEIENSGKDNPFWSGLIVSKTY